MSISETKSSVSICESVTDGIKRLLKGFDSELLHCFKTERLTSKQGTIDKRKDLLYLGVSEEWYDDQDEITEQVSKPLLEKLKRRLELEATQWLKENSPIIPTYGAAIDQEIALPDKIDDKVTDSIGKLRQNFPHPSSYNLSSPNRYKMILNPKDEDERALSNGSTTPSPILSDTDLVLNPRLGFHKTKLTDDQPRGPLYFESLPSSDENPVARIKNMSGKKIVLSAGDIIYHVANDKDVDSGLYWTQSNDAEESVPDSRYAFCITSRSYIGSKETTKEIKENSDYRNVEYILPVGMTVDVSLSHKPIFGGESQNCSRQIVMGDKGDRFFVLGPHYKNQFISKDFATIRPLIKCLYPPGEGHCFIKDERTGLSFLIFKSKHPHSGFKSVGVATSIRFEGIAGCERYLYTIPTGKKPS